MIDDWPYAHGGPVATGRIKAEPEDFIVEEVLGFTPTGAGEHAFLMVEKRGANTDWVAKQLARIAGAAPVAVGYAGLKDRHAVTRQAFTVTMANRAEPDWLAIEHPEFRVLSATRHDRKLKRGALRGNRFRLRVRDLSSSSGVEGFGARLAAIAAHGVPNYFGEQRFGRDGGNRDAALRLFRGERMAPNERGILISAARSEIFNAVLAARVASDTWNRALDGDVFGIDGSGSIFGPEPIGEDIVERLAAGRIHPTGPMWGRGELRSAGDVADLERRTAGLQDEICRGLERAGLEQERRALRLMVRALAHGWNDGVLEVSFELNAGSYATVVLRELLARR